MSNRSKWAFNEASNSIYPFVALVLAVCLLLATTGVAMPKYQGVANISSYGLVLALLGLLHLRYRQYYAMYAAQRVNSDELHRFVEIGHKDEFGSYVFDDNYHYLEFKNGLVVQMRRNVDQKMCEAILRKEWPFYYLIEKMHRQYLPSESANLRRRKTDIAAA